MLIVARRGKFGQMSKGNAYPESREHQSPSVKNRNFPRTSYEIEPSPLHLRRGLPSIHPIGWIESTPIKGDTYNEYISNNQP
jgi:hypothetical protein